MRKPSPFASSMLAGAVLGLLFGAVMDEPGKGLLFGVAVGLALGGMWKKQE